MVMKLQCVLCMVFQTQRSVECVRMRMILYTWMGMCACVNMCVPNVTLGRVHEALCRLMWSYGDGLGGTTFQPPRQGTFYSMHPLLTPAYSITLFRRLQ